MPKGNWTWLGLVLGAGLFVSTGWMIEGGPPNGLIRRGFTKASLPAGTDIVVVGWQAKDDSFRANGSSITLPDGTRLFLASSKDAGNDK